MESSAAAHRNPSTTGPRRRSVAFSGVAGLAALSLLLPACGGDDDEATEESSTTTTIAGTAVTSTTVAPTTTMAATTTTLAPLVLVTEGATIVVANASGVNGAAGRMSDALEVVGFTAADPTNSSEGPLSVTKIYYDPDIAPAKAVADSLREALGAGDIEVLELTVPAPLTDPDTIGDANILVAIGNDVADKSLDELQGRVPSTDDSAEEVTADEATADSTAEEASADASADG